MAVKTYMYVYPDNQTQQWEGGEVQESAMISKR